jgi:ArsR family transcriptional regulator
MVESVDIESTDGESSWRDETADLALAFKALGDPTRLRILAVLADAKRCVCEIQEAVDVPGNLLSHHLKVLREAGLIEGERRGRWIDYRLIGRALGRLRRALPPAAEALGLDLTGCADACAREEARA